MYRINKILQHYLELRIIAPIFHIGSFNKWPICIYMFILILYYRLIWKLQNFIEERPWLLAKCIIYYMVPYMAIPYHNMAIYGNWFLNSHIHNGHKYMAIYGTIYMYGHYGTISIYGNTEIHPWSHLPIMMTKNLMTRMW